MQFTIKQNRLSELMSELNDDELILINKCNFHLTENVDDFDNDLLNYTGFPGSSGKLTVTAEESVLWVDGRYQEMAKKQCEGSGLKLKPLGGESYFDEYLHRLLSDEKVKSHKKTVYLDQRKWSAKDIERFKKSYALPSWEHRQFEPLKKQSKNERRIDLISKSIAGYTVPDKLRWLLKSIDENELHLLTNPEDIAWLMNVRANDFPCSRGVGGKVLCSKNYVAFFSDLNDRDLSDLKKHLPEWIIAGEEKRWLIALLGVMRANAKLQLVMEHHNRPGAMNYHDYTTIKNEFPESRLNLVNRSLVELGRIQKNKNEMGIMKKYGRQCSFVMSEAIEYLQTKIDRDETITERQLAEYISDQAKKLGAHSPCFEPMVASGPYSALPHHRWHSEKRIERNEMVMMDIVFILVMHRMQQT